MSFMSSCYSPPLVPGRIVRRALDHRAAGVDRHRVGEDAVRAVDGLDDVLHRQVPQRLRPVDRRQLLREVERLRRADQILLRRVRRKHRPHLVLLAVEPGDEQHLHRAAAIPVALLVVRADAADAGAEALHVHRGVTPGCPSAATPICHSAVDEQPVVPTLPFDHGCFVSQSMRVVAVGRRRAEDVVVAFGEEVAALVLDDVGVAALDRGRAPRSCRRGTPLRTSQKLKLYGVRTKTIGTFPGGVLRPVDVGGQPHAVAHRHHHLALDDGDRLCSSFSRSIRRCCSAGASAPC